MKDVTITIEIPSDVFIALNETEKGLKNRLQQAIAMMYFKEGRLTLGKAIQLSGLTRFEFEKSSLETLKKHVVEIKSKNYLSTVMDYGDSESVIT